MLEDSANIPKKVTEENFLELLTMLPTGKQYCYIAFYTDKLTSGRMAVAEFKPVLVDLPHLLEIRIFSQECELKAVRLQMGCEFAWRLADETGKSCEEIYEEIHYLDIDQTKAPNPSDDGAYTEFFSTTGGAYTLPVPCSKCDLPMKIWLVNYIRYDPSGNLQIVDYRLKGFIRRDGEYVLV